MTNEHNWNTTIAYLAYPTEIDYPKPVQKLIDAYEAAWTEYDATVIAYHEATAATEHAGEADKRLLIEAVRSKAGDPGTPDQTTAARALVVVNEQVNQAAATLNRAAAAFEESLPEHRTALISAAVKVERARISEHTRAMTTARDDVNRTLATAASIGSTINYFRDLTQGTVNYHAEPRIDIVRFPSPSEMSQSGVSNVLDLLDQLILNRGTTTIAP